MVMDVSQVNMVDPIGKCDFTGSNQGLMRRFFDILHFPVRVKSTEMEGYFRTQFFHHPAAQFFQFTVEINVSRDEQRCDFEPDFGFVFQVFQGIEHGGKGSTTGFAVEGFGEPLEVDVGGIHPVEEFTPCFRHHVTRSDCHRPDSSFPAFPGNVHCVLEENDGVVVGECDTAAAMRLCRFGDGLGRGGIGEPVEFPGFADVPVLAEAATKVAACGAEGKDRGSGEEMIQRLLFHRVNAEAA